MTAAERTSGLATHTTLRTRTLLPGLLVAAVGTAIAFGVNTMLPAVSALTVAVVFGVLVGQFLPDSSREGLRWATKKFLRVGVVLLGLQLGLREVFGLGLGTVLAVLVTVLLAFFGTLVLGQVVGVSPGLGLMVATGFSICGASAIAAMDSVTETDKEDVATGVALVTLYGSAAIALVPLVGTALGMSPEHLRAWAGLSVHEVAQVVAAASPAAVGIAVIVKLTRIVLLAPMVAEVSVMERRRRGTTGGKRPPIIPLFVLGSGVRVGALLRTGRRGLALGALSTVLVAVVGLGALAATGSV